MSPGGAETSSSSSSSRWGVFASPPAVAAPTPALSVGPGSRARGLGGPKARVTLCGGAVPAALLTSARAPPHPSHGVPSVFAVTLFAVATRDLGCHRCLRVGRSRAALWQKATSPSQCFPGPPAAPSLVHALASDNGVEVRPVTAKGRVACLSLHIES